MKKKNLTKEEKKERNLKILKMSLYGGGLLLCAGAFVSLLVIGIRGCAATPKSSNAESGEVVSQPDSINNVRRETGEITPSNSTFLIRSSTLFTVSDFISAGTSAGEEGGYSLPISGQIVSEPNVVGDETIDYSFEEIRFLYSRSMGGHSFSYYFGDNRVGFLVAGNSVTRLTGEGNIIDFYLDFYDKGTYSYLETMSNSDSRLERAAYGNLLSILENNIAGVDVGIHFNSVINPFGPLHQNYNYFANDPNGDYSGVQYIFYGLFYTDYDHEYYTSIVISYFDASATRFGTVNEYTINDQSNSIQYMVLMFEKPDFTRKVVNSQDYGTTIGGNQPGNGVLLLSNSWISTLYQDITILYCVEGLQDYGDLPSRNENRIAVVSSLNNNNSTSTIYIGSPVTTTNPFDLIGSAFSSLAPLLNVYLWPGVTIGVLIFVPLVATIVLFVVWLFKR